MDSLKSSAEIIVNKCMVLKEHESCLVITDANKIEIAKEIYNAAKLISHNTELIEIPVGKVNGEEPSSEISKKMCEYDVIIIPTTKSLSHTKARRDAVISGARLSTLPGITEDMMIRTINVDYDEMKLITNKICDHLDNGKKVLITAPNGTNLEMDIDNRITLGRDVGIYDKKGLWGNLPEAESCLAPIEGTTNGVYVVDGSQAGVGVLDEPLIIKVENGYAVDIKGGEKAFRLKKILDSVNNKNAYNIAELGIGTNKKAIITGLILEDEKVYGTCHIALGNNMSYGGKVDVPIHLDGIINSPTISVDGKVIIKDGELIG